MLIEGWNKSVSRKLHTFQGERISRNALKRLFYDNQYEVMKIWGRTEGATPDHPARDFSGEEVYSIFGPRNQAPWNKMGTNEYINGGYIILYDVTEVGFRTFPFNGITKVEYNGTTYDII